MPEVPESNSFRVCVNFNDLHLDFLICRILLGFFLHRISKCILPLDYMACHIFYSPSMAFIVREHSSGKQSVVINIPNSVSASLFGFAFSSTSYNNSSRLSSWTIN